jgi:hypothetical protein
MSRDYKDLKKLSAVAISLQQTESRLATVSSESLRLRADSFFHPCFDCGSQLVQATSEEMVCAFNHDQLLWFWCGRNQRLQFVSRAKLVARSADKQLRLRALLEELERVRARHFTLGNYGTDWRANANHRLNACVSACGA